jgi:seryl-tRNA synthetase
VIDVRRVRTDIDGVRTALARRGDPLVLAEVDAVAELDERQRKLMVERDEIRARIKTLSKDVGRLRKEGDTDKAEALQAESRALGAEEADLAAQHDALAEEIRGILLRIPNLPSADAPDGAGPEDNVVLRVHHYDPDAYQDHQRVPHWDVAEQLGILDKERAVKLSGSMFSLYRGMGARVLRALTQLALDRHGSGEGAYEEVRPPSVVRPETMIATGQLPKFADDAYHLERDDLWLIPTAEAPLTSMHRDEILDEADLPRRFTAYTPCFRREAGSAGKDTRGTLRTHEFDKVELFAYCTPDQYLAVHHDILERAESIVTDLGLAYRVLDLCTGDLGFSNARTFDIEVYAPGCDAWLEVSSVSWYSDYQARRANVRYRPTGAKSTEAVHTLNGSALAWSRIWPAILETHRQPDGSVEMPKVLQPYLGGMTEIREG